jgi:hypothetical protein
MIGETIAVHLREKDEIHKYTLRGLNVEFLDFQTVGTPAYSDDSSYTCTLHQIQSE